VADEEEIIWILPLDMNSDQVLYDDPEALNYLDANFWQNTNY
jgi:hypothetical protein